VPIVNIYIQDVWSRDLLRNISDEIHHAFIQTFKIPDDDYNHRIIKLKRGEFIYSSRKSEKYMFLEVYIFPGRSRDAKRKLYEELFNKMKKFGIESNDLTVILNEVPLLNWGVNGKPGDETDPGFNLNV